MICENCGHDPDAIVLTNYQFLVRRDPPSLNDRLVNTGPRAHLYRKERDTWCWHFREMRLKWHIPFARYDLRASAIPGQPRGEPEVAVKTDRRRVTLTRVFGPRQRERDFDNLVGGMKSIVDALVSERLIAGDRPEDVQINYGQKRGTFVGLDVLIQVLQ